MADFWPVILRVISVLAGCAAGLMIGGLIYYVFFEDAVVSCSNDTCLRSGKVMTGASILFFLASVYVLHLNIISPIIVSLTAMAITRLLWALGEGLVDSGRMYDALTVLSSDRQPLREFLHRARDYRQIQDLRKVARRMFVPGSPQLRTMEQVIAEVIDHKPGNESSSSTPTS